jgi:hypothetical protein
MSVKKIIIAAVFFGVIFGLSGFVFADNYGLEKAYTGSKLANVGISNTSPESLAATVVTLVLGFVGTIFFLLVLYGGITWMTAMGSQEKVTKAKTILEMAIIGLVIVAASYAISTFIFTKLTAAPATTCGNSLGVCREKCESGEQANMDFTASANECAGTLSCCIKTE